MKLSVISPTYNERENVDRLVSALDRALTTIEHEILVVDDDSPDRTWERVLEVSQQKPHVRGIRRLGQRGLGFAVIDGFKAATGEALACIDADLQHDPSILPIMLEELEKGAEVVVGSRYAQGGGMGEWNWFRRLGSLAATRMAQFAVGVNLRDPMSGYFMLRKSDFLRIAGRLNGEGFKILLEIVATLQPRKVSEVPYTFAPRMVGQSKVSSRVVVQYLRQLYRLSAQPRSRGGRL